MITKKIIHLSLPACQGERLLQVAEIMFPIFSNLAAQSSWDSSLLDNLCVAACFDFEVVPKVVNVFVNYCANDHGLQN